MAYIVMAYVVMAHIVMAYICMEPATIVRSVFELGFEVDSEVVFSVLLAVVHRGFSRLLAQALWWRMRFSTLGSRLLGQRVPH